MSNGTLPEKRWLLTWRKRREMGITFRNVLAKARQLKREDRFDKNDIPSMALGIQGMIVADNPKVFEDPAVDWDAILEFIERLLELLVKFLPIFFGL